MWTERVQGSGSIGFGLDVVKPAAEAGACRGPAMIEPVTIEKSESSGNGARNRSDGEGDPMRASRAAMSKISGRISLALRWLGLPAPPGRVSVHPPTPAPGGFG
jgi:hypothetical protein